MEKTAKKSWTTRAFLISLAALILCSVVNWGIITGWGNVRITNITLVGDNGCEFTGLLYVPKNASNATPAPAYLCSHGYSGNARNHESWSMEYARRGFVVLSIDNFGSGDGEFNDSHSEDRSLSNADNLMAANEMLDYLFTLPFVDKENVVVGGHSMGCNVGLGAVGDYPIRTFVLADPALFGPPQPMAHEANTLWIFGTADKLYTVEDSRNKAASTFAALGADFEQGDSVEDNVTYTNANGYIYRHILIEDHSLCD